MVVPGKKPPHGGRLYQKIAEQISQYIVDQNLAVGSQLPTERDLAQRYRVSRPTIREAVIALEVLGFVEVRMGVGTFITRIPSRAS